MVVGDRMPKVAPLDYDTRMRLAAKRAGEAFAEAVAGMAAPGRTLMVSWGASSDRWPTFLRGEFFWRIGWRRLAVTWWRTADLDALIGRAAGGRAFDDASPP